MTPDQIINIVLNKEFEDQVPADQSSSIDFVKQQHAYLFQKYKVKTQGFENTSEYEELYSCITGALQQFFFGN